MFKDLERAETIDHLKQTIAKREGGLINTYTQVTKNNRHLGHDLSNAQKECNLDAMRTGTPKFFGDMDRIREYAAEEDSKLDLCTYCCP
jgi:hypothetical protein